MQDDMDCNDYEDEWLSVPLHIRKFQHLWNLLNRSIIYASTLLSVIETKQKKRKKCRKLRKRFSKKQREDNGSNVLFDYEDINFTVQNLVDKVVEESKKESEAFFPLSSQSNCRSLKVVGGDDLHNNINSSSQPQYFFDLIEPADLNTSRENLPVVGQKLDEDELDVSEAHENESSLITESSYIRDSGIGASTIKTEVLSISSPEELGNTLEGDLSCLNSTENTASQNKSNTTVDELCTEEDYIKQLVKRRTFCSSPKPNVKQNLFAHEISPLQDVTKFESCVQSVEDCKKSTSVCEEHVVQKLSEVQESITAKMSPVSSSEVSLKPTNCPSPSLQGSALLVPPEASNSIELTVSSKKLNSLQCLEPNAAKVTCPICNKMMGAKSINRHLDTCTGVATLELTHAKKESLRKSCRSPLPLQGRTIRKSVVASNIVKISNDLNVQQTDNNSKSDVCNEKQPPRPFMNQDESDGLSDDDDDVGESTLPTGMESLKSALKETIANNQAFSELVVQAATAATLKEDKAMNAKVVTMDKEKLGNCLTKEGSCLNEINSPKFRTKLQNVVSRRRADCATESEEDEEDVEIEIPSAPTRRSCRKTVSKRSYCEINSDSEDEMEIEQKPMKKRSRNQKKTPKKCDSDEEYRKSEEECKDDSGDKTSRKGDETEKKCEKGDSEEGEVGPSDIDVEELLSKKFYRCDVKCVSSSMEVRDGVRYCNGVAVDPAQPRYLTGGALREYQITGFQWLKILFENGESGILADEMGLGKTVQTIAIICKLVQSGVKGPFLVCAPTSTLNNWFSEIQRFAPKISLLLYHGTAPERIHLLQCFSEQVRKQQPLVLITSYDILMRDKLVFSSYCWSYLVLDEGHRVKNLKSKTFQELKTLTASAKLMLTGTPLQNNLSELWSLLNFLLPEVFDDIRAFESWFDVACIQTNEKILSILHQVLTPFLLRRVKADVEVKIPRKREVLVMAPLAALQDKYYRATVDRSIVQLVTNKEYYNVTPGVANPDSRASNSQEFCDEKNDRATRKLSRSKQTEYLKEKYNVDLDDFAINITLSNMMMQLRKCCNHPYLVQYPLIRGSDDFRVDEDIVLTCGKMMLLDRMLPTLKRQDHKVLLFSQMTSMLDILEDYCEFREYRFVRLDGSTKCDDRFRYIKEFNEDAGIFIFLLSTRAGGLGINLTGADTVIIYDSDWNPQSDLQAQDRCHRIGQKKPVLVYRFVTMGTIDQQIVERAAMKRKLEKMIIHQKKFKGNLERELRNCKVVTPEELLTFLESNEHINVAENKESAISEHDLLRLLDRSDLCSSPDSSAEKMNWFVTSPTSVSTGNQLVSTVPFQVIDETAKSKDLVL